MNVTDVQINLWEKEIKKLTKKSDIAGLERYKDVIRCTTGIDDSIKAQYIDRCETAKDKVPYKQLKNGSSSNFAAQTPEAEVEETIIDASEVEVGESTKHFKLSKKRIVQAIIGVTALVTVGGTICGATHKGNAPKAPVTTESNSMDNTEDLEKIVDEEVKVLNPNLAFDTENTEVLIENSKTFLNDSLTKGVELKEESLDKDLESYVDFYIALNIDEIGPGYMASLYQDDKKSYLDMFNNFVNWSMLLTDEAMMSSQDNVINVSSIVSNKHEAEILQTAFNLLAKQHDNGLTGNMEEIEATTDEFRKLLDDTLLSEESASYSTPFKVILAYSAMNFDTLLQNYSDVKLVDDDVRKIIYEDSELHCAMAMKDSSTEMNQQDLLLLLNASEKNQSAVEFALQLEKKIDQMVLILNTSDLNNNYANDISVNEVIVTLKNEIDLSLYKANQEYTEYNDITYEMNHPVKEVPKDAVIINDGKNYIEKEELDKYDVETDNKTPEQVKDEYEKKVEQQVEEELKDDKTFKDNTGKILEQGEDSVDYASEYSKGYTAGSKQGAIDGNALATKKSTTTGSKGYIAGYAVGYNQAYEDAKAARLAADKETSTTTEKLDTPIVEETEIESGTFKQDNSSSQNKDSNSQSNDSSKTQNSSTSDSTIKETTKNTESESYVQEEVIIETPIIEEEVIEEGILESESQLSVDNTSTTVTLSYEELEKIYYEYLYGSDTTSLEEESAKTKTR